MRRMTLLCLTLVCAAVLIGCGTTNTNNSNTTVSAEKPNTPASSTSASESAPPTGDKIGVPECDEYIAKYESCTGKVPEAGRAAYKAALEQARSSWKQLAANPTTRASLASACKQATETQAAAWKSYGCAN